MSILSSDCSKAVCMHAMISTASIPTKKITKSQTASIQVGQALNAARLRTCAARMDLGSKAPLFPDDWAMSVMHLVSETFVLSSKSANSE